MFYKPPWLVRGFPVAVDDTGESMNISLFSQYDLNLFPIQPYKTILNLQFFSHI